MTWQQILRQSMLDLLLKGTTKTSVAQHVSNVRQAIDKEMNDNAFATVRRALSSIFNSNIKKSLLSHQFQKTKGATSYRKVRNKRKAMEIRKGRNIKASAEELAGFEALVPIYTKDMLKEKAKKLLDIKIQESLDLIKLNREASTQRTLQRLQGWASSIPAKTQMQKSIEVVKRRKTGEFKLVKKSKAELEAEAKRGGTKSAFVPPYKQVPVYEEYKVRQELPVSAQRPHGEYERAKFEKAYAGMKEPVESLKYKERRVAIDQGHKLAAAIASVNAQSNSAIAFTWRQHFTKNPRERHTELDGEVFPIKNSWAYEQGLIQGAKGKYKFVEDLPSQPAEEVYCRCTADYVFNLRELYRRAPHLLTAKGLAVLGIKR